MKERRGHWHLLTGLIIGIAIGLVVSIFAFPVHFIDTEPYALKTKDRDNYRALIAGAYLVEADNGRAIARLSLLRDVSLSDALVAQAQRELREKGKEARNQVLALLAAAVSKNEVMITPLPRLAAAATITTAPAEVAAVQGSPTAIPPTRTPGATITPRPTATPQPTQGAPFELVEQKEVCDAALPGSLIQVYVIDAADEPVAAVRVEVSVTDGGVEGFFTGLYPQISPGYADYAMVEGMTYNLRVGEAGQLVQNLSIPQCENEDGDPFPGSIQLIFRQP